jgi:Ca-activated chloride channel family protein
MNEVPISPDDPRLTAYALDEMEPPERAEFERLLAGDATAREAVAEIRTAGAALTLALENEPVAAGSGRPEAVAPAAIIAGKDLRKLDGGPLKPSLKGKVLRLPQLYFVVSGLAAACFAVIFVIWQQSYQPKVASRIVEMPLAGGDEAEAKAEKGLEDSGQLVQAELAPAAPTAAAESSSLMRDSRIAAARASTFAANEPAQAERIARGFAADGGSKRRLAYFGRLESRQDTGAAFNTEAYGYRKDNAFQRVADQPVSTFSVDVDTASYANVRRFLVEGQRPPADAVRIEELINYFPYQYAPPTGPAPFAASLEVAEAPWNPEHRLVRIGLKGREVSDAARPAANLVFLLDVSGSMNAPNKLPLVQQALRLLVERLRPDDHVAIAVYAGTSGLVLPSTRVAHKAEILDAIARLQPGGSTNGALGIQLAYDIARANFVAGGVNRVILATDGDFNVGVTSEGELVRLIEEKARSGVFLSVLGFGMGNLKDATLEQLADKGNGNYAYIDSLAEARKALVEQAGGTLVTIAKDVKLQVEFNPALVQAYRLIGYENRLLAREDFNDDRVDAGEVGAGHTITALYEVVPAGAEMPPAAPAVDELKYQKLETPGAKRQRPDSQEMLTVKVRYKEPAGDVSSRLEFPLRDPGTRFEDASPDFKFAAAVAAFGMALRESPDRGQLSLADVASWGRAGLGSDPGGYRGEFLSLVERAQKLVQ